MERFIGEVIKKYEDRLTAESREVILLSGEMARQWGHPYVHAGHLAIPLLELPTINQFFQQVGLSTSIARRNLEQSLTQGNPITGEVRTTFSFKRALEIADQLKDDSGIYPQHLLLGVIFDRGFSGIGVYDNPTGNWRIVLSKLNKLCNPITKQDKISLDHKTRENARQQFDRSVKELRDQNFSIREIAGRLDVPDQVIVYAVARLIATGEVQTKRTFLNEEDSQHIEEEIIRLRAAGFTGPVIQEKLGISLGRYIYRINKLKKSGDISPLKQGDRQKLRPIGYKETIIALRDQGLSAEEISSELGMKISTYQIEVRMLIREGRVQKTFSTGRPAALSLEVVEKIKALQIRGLSSDEIREQLGLTRKQYNGYTKKLL